jgi:hypothetical protein
MFRRATSGNATVVARRTHEGMVRAGLGVEAATGLYHHTYDYVADVSPDEGGVFRATFTERFEGDREYRPVEGDTAQVKIFKDGKVEFDRDALRERATARHTSEADEFDAIAAAPPGTSMPNSPAGDSDGSHPPIVPPPGRESAMPAIEELRRRLAEREADATE